MGCAAEARLQQSHDTGLRKKKHKPQVFISIVTHHLQFVLNPNCQVISLGGPEQELALLLSVHMVSGA